MCIYMKDYIIVMESERGQYFGRSIYNQLIEFNSNFDKNRKSYYYKIWCKVSCVSFSLENLVLYRQVFDFSNFIFACVCVCRNMWFFHVCRICGWPLLHLYARLFPAERVFTIQIFVIRWNDKQSKVEQAKNFEKLLIPHVNLLHNGVIYTHTQTDHIRPNIRRILLC